MQVIHAVSQCLAVQILGEHLLLVALVLAIKLHGHHHVLPLHLKACGRVEGDETVLRRFKRQVITAPGVDCRAGIQASEQQEHQ